MPSFTLAAPLSPQTPPRRLLTSPSLPSIPHNHSTCSAPSRSLHSFIQGVPWDTSVLCQWIQDHHHHHLSEYNRTTFTPISWKQACESTVSAKPVFVALIACRVCVQSTLGVISSHVGEKFFQGLQKPWKCDIFKDVQIFGLSFFTPWTRVREHQKDVLFCTWEIFMGLGHSAEGLQGRMD